MHRHFDQDLEGLTSGLAQMISLVVGQIDRATHALMEGDPAVAGVVLERDEEINRLDNEIEGLCQRMFALHQPVATDLRLLMAALKINGQLERIGDIAVNIAERAGALAAHAPLLRSTRLAEMLEIARIMVSDSFEAFTTNNPALATRVLESDDVVDALDRHVFGRLVTEMKENRLLIEPCAHMLMLSRHIERLADHATNIAEDVIFLVEAKIVKHNPPAES